jgi:hypothetical protein
MSIPPEYLALREKVDAFAHEVATAQRGHMQCRAGCAGCCHADLSVSAVEAAAIRAHLASLPAPARAALRQRAAAATAPSAEPPRCLMLDADDRCQIYEARPLVCRTQGLPLRYSAELIPASAVRLRGRDAAVTWCPLNFTAATPPAAQILDAERVDALLALINRKHAAAHGQDPLARTPLGELATEPSATTAR